MRSRDDRERRLITLLCATAEQRRAAHDEMSALLWQVDEPRLVALLRRTGLIVLLGERLLALGGRHFPHLEGERASFKLSARRWGAATELASLEIMDRFASAGIRALPLKGSLLARELYGDVAARSSIDIDVLVAPEHLNEAARLLSRCGWRWETDTRRVGGLPLLHETLVHPSLPRVELHWRVHWYERQFAADALLRAEAPAPGEPLQMQPLDGLVALMLFYARDGFSGLRYPADVAAWWDLRCVGAEVSSPVQLVTERYPALAAPVSVASSVLSDLVGLPADGSHKPVFRWRVAASLTSPFVDGDRRQAEANAALADLLLAPPRAAGDALRRVVQNAPIDPSRPATTRRGTWGASAGHVMRVLRRWVLALVHSYRPRRPRYSRAVSCPRSSAAPRAAHPTLRRPRRSR